MPFRADSLVQKETIGEAAERELKEETNCNCNFLEQFGTYSNPNRDPRRWVISNGYMALVNAEQEIIQAGDDASDAKWFDVSFQEEAGIWNLCLTHGDEKLHARLEETTSKWDVKKKFKTIESDDLAFDHELILADAIVQLRKMDYGDAYSVPAFTEEVYTERIAADS